MINKTIDFSVLMSVYNKENPIFLIQSLDSLVSQTLLPSEVVLVKDGQLSAELNLVIDDFKFRYPNLLKIVSLPNNTGLANALNEGLKVVSNDIIARMDSDDLSFANRFEIQIKHMLDNHLDIVGGQIVEFSKDIKDVVSIRKVPINHESIVKFMKFRSPFSHPTIVCKKRCYDILNGYDINIFPEDYDFFVRAYLAGFKFGNVKENILYFRLGANLSDTIKRRWGLNYAINEFKLYRKFLKMGFFNYKDYFKVLLFKIPLRVLPFRFYRFIYFSFTR
jgi:glycosyltransferase involved in cell wall biosynthesis